MQNNSIPFAPQLNPPVRTGCRIWGKVFEKASAVKGSFDAASLANFLWASTTAGGFPASNRHDEQQAATLGTCSTIPSTMYRCDHQHILAGRLALAVEGNLMNAAA
jgi:hypothetical protein